MKVLIRKAGVDDVEVIQKFGTKTFWESFGKFNTHENMNFYIEKSFSYEQIMRELVELETEFHLAYVDQRIAGYTKIHFNKSVDRLKSDKALEIERIYVDREFHGKNLGKVLLDKCFEIAEAKGMNVVWLGVWEHNPRAIAFYQKWGFEKFGEHVFMLGTDAQNDWLMKKLI
ncbi:MAG TPA: GNAT family N-acetyltransferase [Cyclobacteriaceae bacterium]|nr:GNAT family N-acetyltransferase [Cyclobacteriaceae bacterium]